MIQDELKRDWIDENRNKDRKNPEDLKIVREYLVTEAHKMARRNAESMEVSVLVKIRNRDNGETFRRLWQEEDGWHYTTEAPRRTSLGRFLSREFTRYLSGKRKFSPELLQLFAAAEAAGVTVENISSYFESMVWAE